MLLVNENRVGLTPGNPSVTKTLSVGVYTVHYDDNSGQFYLLQEPTFKLPSKLYGDFSQVSRWVRRWTERPSNLGILLHGLKGSGKTVAAKMFCLEVMKKANSPVIMIQESFGNMAPELVRFLAQPEFTGSVVFFDEFEKVIDQGNNNKHGGHSQYGEVTPWLPLFDGIYNTRLAFVLTSNTGDINDLFLNRPGRIRYCLEYKSVDRAAIREIVTERFSSVSTEMVEKVITGLRRFGDMNFDGVMAILDEIEFFNNDIEAAVSEMNVRPEVKVYEAVESFNNGAYSRPLFGSAFRTVAVDLGAVLQEIDEPTAIFATQLKRGNSGIERDLETRNKITEAFGMANWGEVCETHYEIGRGNHLSRLEIFTMKVNEDLSEIILSLSGTDGEWNLVLTEAVQTRYLA